MLIVERTTKTNMMDYLKPRLFSPLGIKNIECQYSPEGYFNGATGMKLTVNELIAVMADLDSDSEEMRQCIWNTIYPRL